MHPGWLKFKIQKMEDRITTHRLLQSVPETHLWSPATWGAQPGLFVSGWGKGGKILLCFNLTAKCFCTGHHAPWVCMESPDFSKKTLDKSLFFFFGLEDMKSEANQEWWIAAPFIIHLYICSSIHCQFIQQIFTGFLLKTMHRVRKRWFGAARTGLESALMVSKLFGMRED